MTTESNKDSAATFLSMCANGAVQDAFDRYVSPKFRHHNPHFEGSREALLAAMAQSAAAEPNKAFVPKQVIADGDTVAVLSHLTRASGGVEYAVVHVLRFEQDMIVEMWDVAQEIPKVRVNELGVF